MTKESHSWKKQSTHLASLTPTHTKIHSLGLSYGVPEVGEQAEKEMESIEVLHDLM
ncbi:hypothetical protein [Peribacillus sp. SI8-4]|uniref:hypothetical protein n=1 Tax=Peribacillus sp. SI8-4 TaxID=3048009 RepID=UPI002556AFE5|nr:hypothetical protein [Peribacillus sp. SI8-4]